MGSYGALPGPRNPRTALARAIAMTGLPVYIIGAQAGVQSSQIHGYCRGKPIPMRHLVKLAAVLECDPEDLLEPEISHQDVG